MTDFDAFVQTILNLSKFHREHEKFYSDWPLDRALHIRTASRTLSTLADRWGRVEVAEQPARNPYAGCEDLNELASIQGSGVLFMEGEAEPSEIERMKRDLRAMADDFRKTGEWLSKAMEAAWETARALLPVAGLEAVLGERHRIIANDWQAAAMNSLMAQLIDRAMEIVDQLKFSPQAIRADLAGPRSYPVKMLSSVELLDRAATLATESAALVRDNDRRWRVFRAAVEVAADLRARGAPMPSKPDADGSH